MRDAEETTEAFTKALEKTVEDAQSVEWVFDLDKETFYRYFELLENQTPNKKAFRVSALATAFHLGYTMGKE